VAIDAAHVLVVVRAGQIGEGGGREALELLLVQVARDAEVVITLLGGQPDEEQRHEGGEPGQRGHAPGELAAHPPNPVQRTVTVATFEKMMWPDAPAGPPLGTMTPAGVVTRPTDDAFSVPYWNAAATV